MAVDDNKVENNEEVEDPKNNRKEAPEMTEDQKIGQNIESLLNKGKSINMAIVNNSTKLSDKNISDEEKSKLLEKIDDLTRQKNRLRGEIYSKAIEKSGLDYNNGERTPNEAKEKYNDILSNLKKEKQDLEAQKEKQKEIIEKKKSDITAQFNIAVDKYTAMLEAGKISQELYDSRIANMKDAKAKDADMLDRSLENFDKKISDKDKEIEDANAKVLEINDKIKIYDEYNGIYYELFGEDLDKFAQDRIKIMKDSLKGKESSPAKENETTKTAPEKGNAGGKGQTNGVVAGSGQSIPRKEEENAKVVVTSKSMFDELYKKLSNGTINDKELNALTEVLSDENNYDKYGITTGIVFNKAKKILKAQGARTSKNIETFLKQSNEFSDDIKFDASIENEDVLSHDILNSWRDIDNKLVFSDCTLSVDKYIQKIEEYKDAGNELSKKQQEMYKQAMDIKATLGSYRKAINANHQITMARDAKSRNAGFLSMFRGFKQGQTKALSGAKPERTTRESVIIDPKPFDLSDMVYPPREEEARAPSSSTKVKSKEEKTK